MTTIRAVWPELPTVEDWTPYLTPAYDKNWHTNTGPVSQQLETRMHTMFGHAGETVTMVNNATSGLSACLIAQRISGPVICPGFTFQATACAILGANCQPFIVDVDADTGVVTPETLQAALAKSGAKAAMLVAPYGIATDFAEHAAICHAAGAILIIDNAAGLGVARPSVVGPGTVYEVFSLHATKVFGIGEGGAIMSDAADQTALRSAINFGLNTHSATGSDTRPYWGINGKMSEAAAAIGLAVADTFETRVAQRQAMAARWIAALDTVPIRVFERDITRAPWQVFPVVLQDDATTTRFVEAMAAQNIELRRYYKPSLGACSGMPRMGDCPASLDLSLRVAVLPIRSYMPQADQEALMTSTLSVLHDIHR
ncbi:MAG: DegT/DnrJ/EryC1/StrS family aminotransferase [Pseudomonadota bacterium]